MVHKMKKARSAEGSSGLRGMLRSLGQGVAELFRGDQRFSSFRDLFENMGDAIAIYEPTPDGQDFRLVAVNHAMEFIEKVKRQDILGRLLTEAFPDAEKSGLLSMLRLVRRTGKAARFPAAMRETGNYHIRDYYVGQLPSGHLVAVYSDVTRRIRVETTLRQSERTYRAIMENTGTGMIIIENDSTISFANAEFCRMTGLPKAEVEGGNWLRFVDPEDVAFMQEQHRLRRRRPSAALRSYGFRFRDRHGRAKDILLTVDMIPGTYKSVASLIDITERRRAQEQLLWLNKVKAVGQLAAGVAHEINNPLGVILGFAQSMRQRVKRGDPLSLHVGSIVREASRCKELVQRLLVFSRSSQAGDQRRAPASLAVLFSGVAELISPQARLRGIKVVKKLARGLPRVEVNADQVQQILINLCNNAIDAMPRAGVLTLRARVSRTLRGHVQIQVQDTGSGIPEALRDRIFDPFFTTKAPGKGTGLGLSIVHELVDKHQGSIAVSSAPGRGTTFTILLPIRPGAQGSSPAAHAS